MKDEATQREAVLSSDASPIRKTCNTQRQYLVSNCRRSSGGLIRYRRVAVTLTTGMIGRNHLLPLPSIRSIQPRETLPPWGPELRRRIRPSWSAGFETSSSNQKVNHSHVLREANQLKLLTYPGMKLCRDFRSASPRLQPIHYLITSFTGLCSLAMPNPLRPWIPFSGSFRTFHWPSHAFPSSHPGPSPCHRLHRPSVLWGLDDSFPTPSHPHTLFCPYDLPKPADSFSVHPLG